jgi:hypothetical protein
MVPQRSSNTPYFVETEGSLPFSQEIATCFYPEPVEVSQLFSVY